MQTWIVSRHSASHSLTASQEMAMIGFSIFIKTIWIWNLIFRCTNIWLRSQEYALQSIIAVLKAAVPILDHSHAWKNAHTVEKTITPQQGLLDMSSNTFLSLLASLVSFQIQGWWRNFLIGPNINMTLILSVMFLMACTTRIS